MGAENTTTDPLDDSDFDLSFVSKMRHRVIMGAFRYGSMKGHSRNKSGLCHMKERLAMYEETGNTELLPDIANFAMMEFQFPSHPEAHFEDGDREWPRKERDWSVNGLRNWFYRHEGG